MVGEGGVTGRCLCGAVEISVPAGHVGVDVCHCDMCRRWAGGPFFALHAGPDLKIAGAQHIKTYPSSDWAERAFCTECGSNLYYRLVESGDYIVSAGLLDETASLVFTQQVFIEEKPAYYDFANDTKKLTGAELFAKFAPPETEGGKS